MQISPTQTIPWHYHSNVQDTFYVSHGAPRASVRSVAQILPVTAVEGS